MTYELTPKFDARQSFYGKAIVNEDNRYIKLTSYSTMVAEIDRSTNTATVHGTYSATTLRHIKEFLKQYGFPADTKSQIESDYMQ